MDRRWYQFYDQEVPPSIDYPTVTLKDMFNRNAEANPDKPYLIFKDIKIPYKVSNNMARQLANALLSIGLEKGDRVLLMMPNIPQYAISMMACYKIGGVAVGANPLYTVPELTHQFSDCSAKAVIVLASFAEKALQIYQEGKTQIQQIIIVGAKGSGIETNDHIHDYDTLMASGSPEEPAIEVVPEDIAMLQYTGGTTGVSKGCMLSHANLVAMTMQDGIWFSPSVPPEVVRTLATIPLHHIFGMNCNINLSLYGGGTIVLVAQPTPDNILEAINDHEPTCWAAVPALIQGMNQHPGIRDSKIKSMKGICCGSAPLPVEVMKKFVEISGAMITEGYGMSETSNIVTANPIKGLKKTGSIGIPWPDVDIKIVDVETGTKEMATGESGEILIKGPQVMKGYWNNPEETANVFRDGWLYSGDVGYMDEDGYIFIVDRKKDMLLCSGFNVFPREIDEVMYTNPKVLEACTIGVPDEKRGETVKVFVVLKPGESMTEEEVIDFCKQQLAPYKVPKIVEFIDSVPRTSIGKPDRKALRAMEEAKRNS